MLRIARTLRQAVATTPDKEVLELEQRKLVVLVDAHALLFRLYFGIDAHAAKGRGPLKRDVIATNVRHLKSIRPPDAPPHVWYDREMILCIDCGKHARAEHLPGYKSGREHNQTAEARAFISDGIERLCELSDFKPLPTSKGVVCEADDVLATAVDRCKLGGAECVVVSTDKDLFQLIQPRVHFYSLVSRKFVSGRDVHAKLGVHPAQVRDYLALCGDAADRIPGVPGCGPKGASTLLSEFGDLEGIEAALAAGKAIPGRKKVVQALKDGGLARARHIRDNVVTLRRCDAAFEGFQFAFEREV